MVFLEKRMKKAFWMHETKHPEGFRGFLGEDLRLHVPSSNNFFGEFRPFGVGKTTNWPRKAPK